MRCNLDLSAEVSKVAVAALVCGLMTQYSAAAPVRPGPNNPNPNPPVCREKCVFISDYDFAQNSLQKSMHDEDGVLTRIEAEARKRAGVPLGPPLSLRPSMVGKLVCLVELIGEPKLGGAKLNPNGIVSGRVGSYDGIFILRFFDPNDDEI